MEGKDMKQRIRHLLSVLLVCAMVLSILPTSAFARDNLAEATYTSDEGELVESTLVDAFQNVCNEGTVTLLRDVELTETISLENKAVTLLGNGHTVTLAQYKNVSLSGTAILCLGAETDPEASLFTLRTKENLTTNAELIHLGDQAELYMYDGVTLGPATSGSTAAGVGVYGNSRFYMYGGTITGCKTPAAVSGGVYVDEMGQFHMYDGVIEDCEGTRGGAVGLATGSAIGGNPSVAAPLFHMYGGTIRNCTDTYAGGGAVSLRTEKAAQFIMDGGTITDDKEHRFGNWRRRRSDFYKFQDSRRSVHYERWYNF